MHAVRGVTLRVDGRRVRLHHGAVRLGQVHAACTSSGALDTPTTGRGVLPGPGPARRCPTAQRSLLRRDRIGFVFQFFNLLPTLTAAENVALPLLARRHAAADGARARPRVAWSGSGWATGPTTSPRRCPAARCSAWPSPGPWSPSPRRCCATSRPATSTRPDERGDPRRCCAAAGAGQAGRRHGHARPQGRRLRRPARPHPRRADRVARNTLRRTPRQARRRGVAPARRPDVLPPPIADRPLPAPEVGPVATRRPEHRPRGRHARLVAAAQPVRGRRGHGHHRSRSDVADLYVD